MNFSSLQGFSMFYVLSFLFGCSPKYTFQTKQNPPYELDLQHSLEEKCSTDFVEGCAQIALIKEALKKINDLHNSQMQEFLPLMTRLNILLNTKDIPPILNLDFEQPNTSEWSSLGQEATIEVATRIQYEDGLRRMPKASSADFQDLVSKIKNMYDLHEKEFQKLKKKYPNVQIEPEIIFDRLPVNVELDFVAFQTDFRVPNKYKGLINRVVKNFQVEVSLTSQKEKDSFIILERQKITLHPSLTVGCDGAKCTISEDSFSRDKILSKFTFTIDDSCYNLRPELRMIRNGKNLYTLVNFSKNY